MLDDIVLNLSAGCFGGDITNATWVTAASAEFVEGRTTLNFLGKTADPKGQKRCCLSCYLNQGLKEDRFLLSAKLVVQQAHMGSKCGLSESHFSALVSYARTPVFASNSRRATTTSTADTRLVPLTEHFPIVLDARQPFRRATPTLRCVVAAA